METTLIINKLESIKNEKDFDKASFKLNELLQSLKVEIYESSISVSKKGANKKALSYLIKLQKGNRPALGYSRIISIDGVDRQCFTDSYTAFFLKDLYQLPNIDERPELSYPNIEWLFPKIENAERCTNPGAIVECLKKLKAKMYDKDAPFGYLTSASYECKIDVNRLKQVIDILGTTDVEIYLFGDMKPITFIDCDDNVAILLPCRKY